jgi:2-(1,2-epoxy-1,2-dihydrophenyl)acetyl-CoA isomerase
MEDFSALGLNFEVKDQVALLTLNRPQLRNAVDHPLRNAIIAAIAEVRDDPDIRAAVITGAGKAFCSGGRPVRGRSHRDRSGAAARRPAEYRA